MALAFTAGQVASVGTSATLIRAAVGTRTRLTVRNIGTADLQLGGATVTWGTGHLLKQGESIDLRAGKTDLYGITQSVATSVSYYEETE